MAGESKVHSTGNRVGLPPQSCGCTADYQTGMVPVAVPHGQPYVQGFAEQPAQGISKPPPAPFKANDGCANP
jgi:hypothetical protein